jgi:hypothetical protein
MMKRLLNSRAWLALAAVALLSAPLSAQEGSEWNAWRDTESGVCYSCSPSDVGNPTTCPCRINPPIIIDQ